MRGSRRVDDGVAQAEVAVDDGRLVVRRNILGQPRHQLLHLLDTLRLGRAVLLGPALELPREVAARPAEVLEAERLPVLLVEPRHDVVHRIVDRRALGRRAPGYERVDHDAALDPVHDVEDGADDVRVLAQQVGLRHGHVGAPKRRQDAVLAVHCVRRRQELAGRLAPKHVLVAGG